MAVEAQPLRLRRPGYVIALPKRGPKLLGKYRSVQRAIPARPRPISNDEGQSVKVAKGAKAQYPLSEPPDAPAAEGSRGAGDSDGDGWISLPYGGPGARFHVDTLIQHVKGILALVYHTGPGAMWVQRASQAAVSRLLVAQELCEERRHKAGSQRCDPSDSFHRILRRG